MTSDMLEYLEGDEVWCRRCGVFGVVWYGVKGVVWCGRCVIAPY